VPESEARLLAADLAAAESKADPKRRALFATFEGVMRMDGADGAAQHPHH
jgi:hypothetical protein